LMSWFVFTCCSLLLPVPVQVFCPFSCHLEKRREAQPFTLPLTTLRDSLLGEGSVSGGMGG